MLASTAELPRRQEPNIARVTNPSCEGCRGREVGLCAKLSAASFARFQRLVRDVKLAKNDCLGKEGTPGDNLDTVTAGVIDLCKRLPDGRSIVVDLRVAGEAVLTERQAFIWPVTAKAAEACRLCRITYRDLERLARQAPDVTEALADAASQQVRTLYEHLAAVAGMGVDERVAWFILHLRQRMRDPGLTVEIPVTRPLMAEDLGLRTETVSRALGRLKDSGIISLPSPRRLVIRDMARLVALAKGV